MGGNAGGVKHITLKNEGVAYTIRTSLGGQTSPQGISQQTALLIATDAINTFPAALMNLPSGSKVSWEMKVIGNSLKEREKSSKGRKRKSKKSPNTGGRS